MKTRFQVFDGLDASGKTTLLKQLHEEPNKILHVGSNLFQNKRDYFADLKLWEDRAIRHYQKFENEAIFNRGLFSFYFYQLLHFEQILLEPHSIYFMKNMFHYLLLPNLDLIKARLKARKILSFNDQLILKTQNRKLERLINLTLQIFENEKIPFTISIMEKEEK